MSEFKPKRQWTIYLIHHSHTDIGYTQMQSRIARFHADFLDQAIAISRQIRDGDSSLAGFKWTNECFWSIEQWLRTNGKNRVGELLECIREGSIGLTATYLHFNELIDEALLRAAVERAGSFARAHDLVLDTAISADINGFGWGYADVLREAGVDNLITSVHSHHGLAPFGKRQYPFFWETPKGGEIFVWSGEHYNLGNALGLTPGAGLTYGFKDEWNPPMRLMDNAPVAAARLPRYLYQLECDGYPYDFTLLQASGAMTDNAPPSAEIIRFVNQWNREHGDSIRIIMATPSEFCRVAREKAGTLPRHRGDWPDWWSDGFAGNPNEVRLAREGMRLGRWVKQLAASRKLALPHEEMASLEDQLLLFTEHTFNHSDAMESPWSLIAKGISGRKNAMASAAYEAAMDACDQLFATLGECPNEGPTPGERLVYKAINPLDHAVTDLASFYLEKRDYALWQINPTIRCLRTGEAVAYEQEDAPRGCVFNVQLTLGPGEEAVFELGSGSGAIRSMRRNFTEEAAQDDVEGAPALSPCREGITVSPSRIETPFFQMEFGEGGEIVALKDKASGLSLLDPGRIHAPFTPVYEVTPVSGPCGKEMSAIRRSFGRNRKGPNVRRDVGQIVESRTAEPGRLQIARELVYRLEGTEWVRVTLKVWREQPRIDVAVRLHKKSVWEPENLYFCLPFALAGGQLWVDKPGGPLRPWQDQLPDTLTDWFTLQDGYGVCAPGFGLAVATPDSPLLQLGPLEYGKRRVMGHPDLRIETARPYAWLMTNYWETNFEANLGGFHEFHYRLEFGPHLADPQAVVTACRALNAGLKAFRSRPEAG